MAEELDAKTEIEQFHGLAEITGKLGIPVTMSADSIVSLSSEIDALQAKLDIAREAFNDIDWSGLNATDNFEDMCRKLSKVARAAKVIRAALE